MISVEGLVLRLDKHLGLRKIFRPLLRSEVVWRASGLTYATAVIATTGSYSSSERYLSNLALRMEELGRWFQPTDRVMEFGCGLGGNLIGLASRIQVGFGVDVNPGYVNIANKLAERAGVRNVTFTPYDGHKLSSPYLLNGVISIGVFERLPKPLVLSYLSQFREVLAPRATLILYFLTDQALRAGFGRVLGESAYVSWSPEELSRIFAQLGFEPLDVVTHFPSEGDTYVLRHRGLSGGTRPSPARTEASVGS